MGPVRSSIHSGQKIAGDCSLTFSLEQGEKQTLAQSRVCPEKGRLFPCLNLVSRKTREGDSTTAASGHQRHGGRGEQLSAGMQISPGGKQGPLSGLRARGLKWLPGGLADGRSSGKQRWVQGGQGLQCPLRKCQGWEGRSQQHMNPAARKGGE